MDGKSPGGVLNWVERSKESDVYNEPVGEYSKWLIPKFSSIERGSRLTEERASQLIIGKELTKEEKALFIEMLYCREKVLAFDFSHCGKIRPEVAPPQVIEHEAWQVPGFPVVKMLRERLKNEVLEHCSGPCRNPWFLVKKKPGEFRLINAAMEINRCTVRDANLSPSVDDFVVRWHR
jgi:hypothetical protein